MKILNFFIIAFLFININCFAAGNYETNNAKDTDVVYSEALKLINKKDYNLAIPKLKKLLNKESTYFSKADIYNYLGYSHRKIKKYKKAEKYYTKALKIKKDHIGALEYIGELYIETDKIEKAKEYLEKLKLAAGEDSIEYVQLYSLIHRISP
jgi:tetratricopeptide (TPR) repeat protein|tara:strand:- start:89 stop:547 length:459 start_codon:yes stop_codon:yes gene_type:complete